MSLSPKKPLGPMWSNIIDSRHDDRDTYVSTSVELPPPTNLPAFLDYASRYFQLPYDIHVQIKEEEEPEKALVKLTTPSAALKSSEAMLKSSSPPRQKPVSDTSTLILFAGVNKSGEVINLTLPKGQRAPRVLIRTIALCLPYQRQLTKLNLQHANFLNGAFIYDIAQMLFHSFITELHLDDSPVLEANQHLILDSATQLQRLTLDRCHLCDAGVIQLAAALEPPRPAAYTLLDLSLSTNAITDKGVAALTNMLRSNRKLMRLNLSGNQISDKGGEKLFSVFGLFDLTLEEEKSAKKRHLEYHIKYRKAVNVIFEQEKLTSVSTARRKSMVASMRARKALEASASVTALAEARKQLGEFEHPFVKPNVTLIDGKLYCLGNLSLCSLNLAYNNLRRNSIVMLIDVLRHQSNILIKNLSMGCGLLRVVIDGNDPFVSTDDLRLVSELLDKSLERRGSVKKRRAGGGESFSTRTSSMKFKTKGRS